MSIRDGFNTMTTKGVTTRMPLPGLPDHERQMIFYFNVYPNLFLSIAPDYVLTHYMWPTGPTGTYVETEWFFSVEQMAASDFDGSDAVEFWDTTNRQDWGLCENAQQGLRSDGHRPGGIIPGKARCTTSIAGTSTKCSETSSADVK